MSNKFLYVCGTVLATTDDAVLVDILEYENSRGSISKTGGDCWFPFSQIDCPDEETVGRDDDIEIGVPKWLMREKDLL